MQLSFTLSPRRLMQVLVAACAVLSLLGWASTLVPVLTPYTTLRGTTLLFQLGNEANVPTFFTALLHLMAAALLAFLAQAKRAGGERLAVAWLGLALVFFGLAMDEVAQIHEWSANVARPLVRGAGLGDIFVYAWLAPGVAFVAVCGVVFARLFFSLERRTQVQFGLAAVLFLSGAMGLEWIESWRDRAVGHDLGYLLLVNLEETLEMAGVLVFIRALLGLLQEHGATAGRAHRAPRVGQEIAKTRGAVLSQMV